MSQYVTVTDLPAPVIGALKSVGYGKKDIRVEAAERVTLSSAGQAGCRAFVTLVNLTTGQHSTTYGSWGGANMFNPANPVDLDDNSYPLPADGVAIRGSMGGGQPVHASLHIPASMVARMLPGPAVDLSHVERQALQCYVTLKSGQYRQDALRRANVTTDVIDGLVTRGFLARNRAGAISVTTAGKNAARS